MENVFSHRVTKTEDENLNLRAASASHNSKFHLGIVDFRYSIIDDFSNMQVRIDICMHILSVIYVFKTE